MAPPSRTKRSTSATPSPRAARSSTSCTRRQGPQRRPPAKGKDEDYTEVDEHDLVKDEEAVPLW